MSRSHPAVSRKESPGRLLEELPHGLSERVLARGRRLRAAKGERIFLAGARPRWIYFVLAGEVHLVRAGRQGSALVLQRTRRGVVAPASLSSPTYHCDGVCAAASDLVALPVLLLREEIDRDAATRWAWIATLEAQLRDARARAERLAMRTVRERLAHWLRTAGGGDVLELNGTRRQLAEELGCSHEALYRLLARMTGNGELRIVTSKNRR